MRDRTPMILVAGHVCLDIIPRLGASLEFEPGKLVEAGPVSLSPGGAVSNVGAVLAKLGVVTRLVGKLGCDGFGSLVASGLAEIAPGADIRLKSEPAEGTSYSIVLNLPGSDRMFIHCPGANQTFRSDDVSDDDLAGVEIVHFGYPPLMRSIYESNGAELVNLFTRARSAGIRTSLDMSLPDRDSASGRNDWRAFLSNVLPHTDLFTPSMPELSWMLGGEGHVAPRQLAEEAIRLGTGCVLLKMGEAGVYFRNAADTELWQSCFPVEVVGTTGAGDATIAGFLAAMVDDVPIREALQFACAVGACCCEAADAVSGVPDRNAVNSRWMS